MNVLEAIAQRQSVRSFRPDPVPEETLLQLIDAAHQAPSSWNLQPWEFVMVTDSQVKQALAVAANNQVHVAQAGVTFVILGSLRQQDALANRIEASIPADASPERRERTMRTVARMRTDHEFRKSHVLNNTYIGISWLVLAAQGLGLHSVWMGGFKADEVKALLGIPDDYLVASLVSVGYPSDDWQPKPRRRRPLGEIYSFNRFGAK